MSNPNHRLRLPIGLLFFASLAVCSITFGAAGDLDPSFDADGKAITDFGKSDFAEGMVIQRSGKITVVGHDTETDPPRYYRDFVLARYLMDGNLDPAFGGGRVRTDFGGGSDSASDVVEQPDGRLVVAGWSAPGQQLQFAVARYNDDASLDSTFDGDGKALSLSERTEWPTPSHCNPMVGSSRPVRPVSPGAPTSRSSASLRPAASTRASMETGSCSRTFPAARTSSRPSACRATAGSSSPGWRFRAGISCSLATARMDASTRASTATER